MPLLDSGYNHWEGTARGIWYRRMVIAGNGLGAVLGNKWFRMFLWVAWATCILMVSALFAVGQLIVPDSMILTIAENFEPRMRFIVGSVRSWLEENPDVAVHTVHNFLFYQFTTWFSIFNFIAVAFAIPHLITLDLQSRAILVYSSKALTRVDYMIGKFLSVVGVMCLVWTGPIIVAWVAGNALSPDWTYFIFSRHVLVNVLCFTGIGMSIMGVLALGVSAVSKKERSTTGTWIVLWLLGLGVQILPLKRWLNHCSIWHNLDQIGNAIFNVRADLEFAATLFQWLDRMITRAQSRPRGMVLFLQEPQWTGVYVALGGLLLASVAILYKRVKPE
ncbi:MAG: hypothetical protein CMO80_15255 [Verrucomicrobiales bacterium]|nr:hypothetical protein [Verrucomicrobiales bacterium]|tara:strand:- start:424 stop:1422 length:999 start_codon:yes stop_codon:yes gene_type:complete